MTTLRQLAVRLLQAALFAPLLVYGASSPQQGAQTAKAAFAGGCFWCMQEPYDELPGVISTTVGYMGGHTRNPTYEEVSTGRTGHAESILVEYDPKRVSYEKLLEVFWHNIDPTQRDGQFCDHGTQYRTIIFYFNDAQRKAAEASRAALMKNKPFKGTIVTQIVPATQFYPAESYHQEFYKKNPLRYKFYRAGCGRDARLEELWGSSAGK